MIEVPKGFAPADTRGVKMLRVAQHVSQAAFPLLHLLDSLLTEKGLSRGNVEANPISRALIDRFGFPSCHIIKYACGIGLSIWAERIEKQLGVDIKSQLLLSGMRNLLVAGVCLNNFLSTRQSRVIPKK